LSVGEPVAGAREALARDLGITAGADNAAAVRGAAVVVLAVKPQDAASVLTALAGQWGAQGPLLISVAAGLRVAALQAWCGPGVAVVRAMPNRPALVGAAATGLFAPPGGPRSRPGEAGPRRRCAYSRTRACAPPWRGRSRPRRCAGASWPRRTQTRSQTAGDP